MSVLFAMPNWNSTSELWMHRMIKMIEDDIGILACNHPELALYNNKIPTANLFDTSFLARLQRRLNFPMKFNGYNHKLFIKDAKTKNIDKVLINYLTLAVELEELIKSINIPIFVHCHGYDIIWDLKKLENNNAKFHSDDYLSKVQSLSDRVIFIANSNYTIGRLKEVGIKDEKIILKPYGVIVPKEPIYRSFKSKLKILYLGRLVDFKGPDIVIQAFDLARREGLNAELIIAGDGYLSLSCKLLRERSKYKNDIHLVGPTNISEGEKLRRESDIFTAHNCKGVFSNQEEALGVSVLEAMSASLPVVSAKNGALTETVVDQETGILVEPGDINTHAKAFIRLSKDVELRNEMGYKGWKRVKDNFSHEKEKQVLHNILIN